MADDKPIRVNEITLPDGRVLSAEVVTADLRGMIGQRLEGGCQDCATSWHEYTEDTPGVIDLFVHHDETCPQLRAPDEG